MPGQSSKPKAQSRTRTVLLMLVGLAGACNDCPDSFELSERRVVRPDERIVLTVPDGELVVVGRERNMAMEVEAKGCRARGGATIVMDSADGSRGLRVAAPRSDVRAYVPAGVELIVRHGSGTVELRAVGPTLLTTRGGDVRVQQVIGTVGVEAGPGTLYVRDVIGDVDVVDGPGAVFIERIAGHVRVRDGSGGIHLREIDGDALIEADGSGGIDARTVGGDFVVRAKIDDRNMVRHADVSGEVRLPD